MYNLLIADDEILERVSLAQRLKDAFADSLCIYTAANGREALEAARANSIEIALMDIEMPGINGVEASRRIKECLPECQIIFLTAYSEFSYAQDAVQMGAVGYLLKPADDESLHSMIQKAAGAIDINRAAVSHESRIDSLTSWVEEQLVLSIMSGLINEEKIRMQLDELSISFLSGVFIIVSSPDEVDARRLREFVSEYKSIGSLQNIVFEYDGRLFIFSVSGASPDCRKIALAEMGELCEIVKKTFGIRLYVSIGNDFTELSQGKESFYAARAAHERCDDHVPVVISPELPPPVNLGDSSFSSKNVKVAHLTEKIQQYIRKNYARDLFLQQVAQEMHYTESYFSKLFKQCFNKNFINYLTEVRVEIAKDMLCHTTLSIKDVSASVGYQDPNYFTKVFRRMTGEIPSEYRSRMIGEQTASGYCRYTVTPG